jgi:hypothetical protein
VILDNIYVFTTQIIKELPTEAHCSFINHLEQEASFPCTAGDYSDNHAPIGVFKGHLAVLSVNACNVEDVKEVVAQNQSLIALVPRGGCSFRDKVVHLQAAGYSCVVIVDFEDSESVITPAVGGGLGIPVVMIGFDVVRRNQLTTPRPLQSSSSSVHEEVCNTKASFPLKVKIHFFRPNESSFTFR